MVLCINQDNRLWRTGYHLLPPSHVMQHISTSFILVIHPCGMICLIDVLIFPHLLIMNIELVASLLLLFTLVIFPKMFFFYLLNPLGVNQGCETLLSQCYLTILLVGNLSRSFLNAVIEYASLLMVITLKIEVL